MSKKVLSLVLAFAMILGSFSFVAAADFTDVPADHYAAEEIKEMVEAGILEGHGDGTFTPNNSVTRAQFAAMVNRALGLTETGDAEFTDVDEDDWFYEDVLIAVENGYAEGVGEGRFAPNSYITRQDAATMIGRAFELEASETETDFTDADEIRDYAVGFVNAAAELGIINGYPEGDFKPAYNITRAQSALVVYRALNMEVDELEVVSVSAITLTGVTVKIAELDEDLKDANVVVRNSARQIIPTIAKDLTAGTTETTFYFVNPLTYNPGGDWTVNGIAYDAGEFGLVDVEMLTANGKYLEIIFNQPLESLDASQLSIRNADTLERVGVESVTLSADGMSVQVTLLGSEDQQILSQGTNYTASITADGKVSSFEFEVPFVDENVRIDSVDMKNRTINGNINVPSDMEFDFEDTLGKIGTVWTDSNRDLIRIVPSSSQVIKHDAIKVTKVANGFVTEIELLGEDEKYDVTGNFFVAGVDASFDYAKVTFDRSSKINGIYANGGSGVINWEDLLLVEKVEDDVVFSYGAEEDLEDYVIVKDGKTISIDDVNEGDILFFNSQVGNALGEDGFAEVYNNTVTGEIEEIFNEEIEVDGEDYEYAGVKYIDEDGEIATLANNAASRDELEKMQDAGEVTLHLDRAGDLVFITGEFGEIETSKYKGLLTEEILGYKSATRDMLEFEVMNSEGVETLYNFRLSNLDFVEKDGVEYEIDDDEWSIKLGGEDIDDRYSELELTHASEADFGINIAEDATEFDIVEVFYDKDDNIEGLGFSTAIPFDWNNLEDDRLELDDNYVASKRLRSNTVVYDVTDEDDITVTTWGELSSIEIEKADVYFNSDNEVTHLVIHDKHDDQAEDTVFGVLKQVRTVGTDITRINIFVNGVDQQYTVDDVPAASFAAGQAVELTFNKANTEVVDIDLYGVVEFHKTTSDFTGSVGNNTFTLNGVDDYTLVSGAQIYELRSNGDVRTRTLRQLINEGAGTDIEIVIDEPGTKFVKAVIITELPEAPEEDDEDEEDYAEEIADFLEAAGALATLAEIEDMDEDDLAAAKTEIENARALYEALPEEAQADEDVVKWEGYLVQKEDAVEAREAELEAAE